MIYKDMILTCAATNGINFQPWKWNGTNFSLAAQINPFMTNSGAIVWATNHNAAYIMANDGTYGYELWKYDGTNATRITDFSGIAAYYTFAFKNEVYFMADDGITGLELWKYDGTTVSQVADINLGYPGSMATRMQEYNNAYYFSADDGVFGNELWRLDPVSQLVRITSITKQGNNIALSWTSPGGMSNVLQSATTGASGSFINNFSDRSAVMIAPTGSVVTLNYLDIGGATNKPARYYRIRLP